MDKTVMQAKLKQIQDLLAEIPGGGNMSVNRKGELKISLTLPADEVIGKGEDLSAVMQGRWKMVPILMFVEE